MTTRMLKLPKSVGKNELHHRRRRTGSLPRKGTDPAPAGLLLSYLANPPLIPVPTFVVAFQRWPLERVSQQVGRNRVHVRCTLETVILIESLLYLLNSSLFSSCAGLLGEAAGRNLLLLLLALVRRKPSKSSLRQTPIAPS